LLIDEHSAGFVAALFQIVLAPRQRPGCIKPTP
jgi:hypothetical protein